jgi:hypothetical protein
MDSNRTAIELFLLWSQQSQSQQSSNQNDYSNSGSNININNNSNIPQHPTASDYPNNNNTNTMYAAASAPRTSSTMGPPSLSYSNPSRSTLLLNANIRAQQQLQQHQHQQRARPAVANRMLGERELFLIFIKILFKCIERSSNGRLRLRAKAIVTECTRRNRMGDSNFSPLQGAVEIRLKEIVGDMFWNQAKVYTGYYCQQKGIRTVVSV